MKICPKCGTQLNDTALFCHNCGEKSEPVQPEQPAQQQTAPINDQAAGQYQQNANAQGYAQPSYVPPVPPVYTPVPDPRDHTSEYDAKDISDNKVFAMLPYLLGIFGIIIALIASKESKFTRFHVAQALKITVVEVLMIIILFIASVILIIPYAGIVLFGIIAVAFSVCSIILFVLSIIAFFDVCKGKAREIAIICNFKFLK